jgi:PiT family inorganic phosphate transporter
MFLAFIKARVEYAEDKIAAARLWVPILTAIMAGAFAAYLSLKGLRRIVDIDMGMALLIGLGIGVLTLFVTRPLVRRQSEGLENRKKSLKKLFGVPLVASAALLSFAHGANDVANAVGPLAAIVHAVQDFDEATRVIIPLWVMIVGAAGLSFGLMLFGPKLIRMVGSQITKLNPMRAFCVALSAAITVIVASGLGLPVSSTHIAVGAIFGVGFYREWHAERRARALGILKGKPVAPEERRRRKLVRRSHFLTIIAAWVLTVPATSILSALVFSGLSLVTL